MYVYLIFSGAFTVRAWLLMREFYRDGTHTETGSPMTSSSVVLVVGGREERRMWLINDVIGGPPDARRGRE